MFYQQKRENMKNIKKSIMLVTTLLLTTSSMANEFHSSSQNKQHKKTIYDDDNKGYQSYKNKNKKERRSHRGDISRFFIGTVYSLHLTKEQEIKIDRTIQDFKDKRFNKFNGFTKDGFDKQKFVEARKKANENKIKLNANLIEKIYHILNKKQILQINKEMTMFKKMQEIETYKQGKKW
jgi:hypothetical protein